MIFNRTSPGNLFLTTAMVFLLLGMIMGIGASLNYVYPGITKSFLAFHSLRPLHVTAVLFWILLGATGCLYSAMFEQRMLTKEIRFRANIQWVLWIIAGSGILVSCFRGQFGGREYWEADPVWSIPVLLAWAIFLINFIAAARKIRKWPVYIWMWMTGIIFFLFTFVENYLWILPYFREHIITDITIQWKANGSLVGAWNQLIYGTAFYLMDRIEPERKVTSSQLTFTMYFLGLFNLMFNWGHHIYLLPTAPYVRHIGYVVSMTEWVIFLRIIYNWKSNVREIQRNFHYYPYRFLMASDIWVAVNLFQALLMSVPAINLYTHGTHITVAHAMGTTIGINSMILLAACFYFLPVRAESTSLGKKWLNLSFWFIQFSLLAFWFSLVGAGITKALWSHSTVQEPFAELMKQSKGWFVTFMVAGILLTVSVVLPVIGLLRNSWKKRPYANPE